MRSLKGTLFRGMILGTVLVLVVAGTVLYFSVNRQLVRQMDDSLTDKALMLALSVEEKHYGLEVDLDEMRTEEMEGSESPEYIYIGSLDGSVLHHSDILEGIPAPGFQAPLAEPLHDWHIIKGAGRMRSVLVTFQPEVDDEKEDLESAAADSRIIVDKTAEPGDRIVIQLFKDVSQHQRFMEIFLFMLLGAGLGSIGVLTLTIWLTIKRGAEPINELAASIDSISDDDLAIRLDEVVVLEELAPIIHKFNLFLDRLEKSFNREKGFTSDAAHELRTPLAGLKSTIEVALARKREGDDYRETLEGALSIVNQLENLVKSLLALARLESGQESASMSEVRIEKCIRDVWGSYSGVATERGIETSFNFSNGSVVMIDSALFAQVLDELFRNALYYVDQGGLVTVNLLQKEGNTHLQVGNTGSKISAEEAERVFDRFWRGSHSRYDTGLRFGLGLPIVRKIVDTMGMRMDVKSEMDGEFVVILTIGEGK